MSLAYQTYLGPYFVCKVKQTKRTETYKGCVNPECQLHRRKNYDERIKFCAFCGRPMGYCELEVEKDGIAPEDVREAVKERLCLAYGDDIYALMKQDGAHIWLGNMRGDGVGRKLDPTEDSVIIDFLPNDIPEQMNQLIKFYSDAFVTLKRLYGADNVGVKWGLINQIW